MELDFSSGKIIVTDPCYSLDVTCTKVLNVKKGEWMFDAYNENMGDWGCRNKNLVIKHFDCPYIACEELVGLIGVDSGQAGFFDYEYYKKYHKNFYVDEDEEDNNWYERVCEITLNDPNYGMIDNMGCVSESGYGDGMYEVYAGRDENGEIVEVMIVFISEEEEYEDEDNYEDEEYIED